jgi:hypothetical protein
VYCSKCGSANAENARFAPVAGHSGSTIAAGPQLSCRFLAQILCHAGRRVHRRTIVCLLLLPFGLTGMVTAAIARPLTTWKAFRWQWRVSGFSSSRPSQ